MKKINYGRYYWQNNLVRLRAMKPDDWEIGYCNLFDSEARRYLQSEIELPPTESIIKENIEKFINFNKSTGRIMFVIENLKGENVGCFNLNSINEKNGTFSIGIQINNDHRGKGYGTAAMRLLLNYAFFERRLNKFFGFVLEGNIASEKMLLKLGCKKEGVRRKHIYTNGQYYDEILFGLLKEEYIENEKKYE